MRTVAYPNTNCFMVCFSLVERESLKNACKKWKDELAQLGPPNAPKLLVGLKSDLRDEFQQSDDANKKQKVVTAAEVKKAAEDNHFNGFIECSAKTRKNLSQIFIRAVKLSVQAKPVVKVGNIENA